MADVKEAEKQAAAPEGAGGPPWECPPASPAEEIKAFPSHFARLFFGAVFLLVLYYSYAIIKPYLLDIFLALVLFFVAKPLFNGVSRVFYGWRALASALTCLLLGLFILLPLVTLVSIIANQALELSSSLSKGLASGSLWEWANAKVEALQALMVRWNMPMPSREINVEGVVRSLLAGASTFIYNAAVGLLKGFTGFLVDLALVLFIAFFMFLQGDDFISEVKKLSPLDTSYNEEILQEMEATIKATLFGTVVVAFVQGALGGIGFLLFKVPQPAFWAVVMIPAAVIPVVGSAIIWFPAVLYLFFLGSWSKAVGLFLWCVLFIGSVDNLIKPLLMRGTRYTPSIFILLSILGGIEYFGVIGFILGPLVLSFLLSFINIYRKTILAGPRPAAPLPTPEKEKPTA